VRVQLVRPGAGGGQPPPGDDEVAVLAVVDGAGRPAYASVLTAGADACAAADAELGAAGWLRAGAWTPVAAARGAVGGPGPVLGPPCTAEVRPVPRVAVTAADARSLEGLRRLTTMARGPVTAAALVPHVAPRWQTAAALLRRLVEAGQVRSVGRTADRDRRLLYAPVGSPWAETVVDPSPPGP
jgi:hypothetical protein